MCCHGNHSGVIQYLLELILKTAFEVCISKKSMYVIISGLHLTVITHLFCYSAKTSDVIQSCHNSSKSYSFGMVTRHENKLKEAMLLKMSVRISPSFGWTRLIKPIYPD